MADHTVYLAFCQCVQTDCRTSSPREMRFRKLKTIRVSYHFIKLSTNLARASWEFILLALNYFNLRKLSKSWNRKPLFGKFIFKEIK